MAGNSIYDHHAAAHFHIFFFELLAAAAKVIRHSFRIRLRNIDHELTTAGTTKGAINLRGNIIIQAMNNAVNFFSVFIVQKGSERQIFFFPFFRQFCDECSICFGKIDVY